jgi:hypothetical protein
MTFDIDAVGAFAATFPDVTRGTRWGNRTWLVAGKAFVWERPLTKADVKRWEGTPVPDEPIIAIRTEDLQDKLAILAGKPAGAFDIQHFANYPAYLIELTLATDEQVREAITDGWLAVAPPALARDFLDR